MFCTNCGKKIDPNSKFCIHCGVPVVNTSSAVLQNPVSNFSQGETAQFKGIGGWLVVVALGLIVTAGFQIYTVFSDINLFANGTVATLSDVNSQGYVPAYGGFLTFELIASTLLSVAAGYLLYLFFKENHKFPRYYIILLVAIFIYVLLEYIILSSLTFPAAARDNIDQIIQKTATDLGRGFLSAIIWGLYMVKSKRVKATFIK